MTRDPVCNQVINKAECVVQKSSYQREEEIAIYKIQDPGIVTYTISLNPTLCFRKHFPAM